LTGDSSGCRALGSMSILPDVGLPERIGAMVSTSARFFLIAFCSILALAVAKAIDWPEGHTVLQNSTSSDGRYGVLVVSREAGLNDARTGDSSTYLANLQTRQTIGEIKGIDYFEGQNHAGLEAVWAPDSKACVVQYDSRYGWESVFVLKMKDDGFEQIDIGKHIEAIQKRIFDGYLSGYYRFTPDGKLKVRALSYTNPKQFAEVPTYNGVFQGTFDLKSKKWTATDVRKVKEDLWSNLQTAYDDSFAKHIIVAADDKDVPENFTGSVFRSEGEKFDALDKQLNEVYQAVRSILPPNRFAKIKQEQVEWLKKRDAASSIQEKCKLTEARTKALQELVW
jgi:uncharacterized protein YecT (DUF1311 family)